MGRTYQWYQELDAAYFDLYQTIKDSVADAFRPFKTGQAEFIVTCESIDLNKLSEDVAFNFTSVVERINQTLNSMELYGNQYAMMGFSSMYMLSDLTSPASNFKSLLMSPLMTFFSYFTMQMEPLSEECERTILSQIIPTLEPFANKYLDLVSNASTNWPNAFESNLIDLNSAIIDINSLISKVKLCAGASSDASTNSCIGKIVSKNNHLMHDILLDILQNQRYGCFSYCTFDQDIYTAASQVMSTVSTLNSIFYSMQSSDWSMEAYNKVAALKDSCQEDLVESS